MAAADEMKIKLDLKYPLYLRRYVTSVWIVDATGFQVAQCEEYNHGYELVRLANAAYKLFSDLSKAPYENTPNPSNTPRRPETEPGISDPAKANSPRMRD
jgi:hypothetical protein